MGWVNQRLLSGPLTMPPESPPMGTPFSVTTPDGVDRPMPPCRVNQSLPSGPAQIAPGELGVGIANSVIVMSGPLMPTAGGPPAPPIDPPVPAEPSPVVVAVDPPAPVTLVVAAPVPPAPGPCGMGPSPSDEQPIQAAPATTQSAVEERRLKRATPESSTSPGPRSSRTYWPCCPSP